MSNSVLELRLTSDATIANDGRILFNEQLLAPAAFTYDKGTGIIKFEEAGQYSIKWWVATETTLKGTMGFHLISSQSGFTPIPGCSPIKTGQVTGFGFIDVGAKGVTMSLINKTPKDTVISKKTGTKAYLLITPIGASANKVYRGNISTRDSFIDVPIGGRVSYRLEYLSATTIQLALTPMGDPVRYDYRRLSGVDGYAGMEGSYADSSTLTARLVVDTPIYNNSREIHWVLLRILNPASGLWSLYEIRHFVSGSGARATIWVNTIEEEVAY